MPVAQFACPACDRAIRPAEPLEEGKRIRCPRCDVVVSVPAAAAPARDEAERPSKQPAGKPRRFRRSGRGSRGAFLVGATLLAAATAAGVYFAPPLLRSLWASHQDSVLDEATALLARVKDRVTAEFFKRDLLRVAARLRSLHPGDGEAARRLAAEAVRVLKVPGGKELVQSFLEIWGPGSEPVSGVVEFELSPAGLVKAARKEYAKVEIGWTERQVTDLLGAPSLTFNNGPGDTVHQYPAGWVQFKDGKVTSK